jgi:hypothetical protein
VLVARSLALALLVLLAGCAATEGPPERLLAPNPCFSRAPLPFDERQEVRAYELARRDGADEVAELVHVALPEDAWRAPAGITVDGPVLRILAIPAAHERIARILGALARASKKAVAIEARTFEVDAATVAALGPPVQAAGSGDDAPFLRVTLGPPGIERLVAYDADHFKRLTVAPVGVAPAGRWVDLHIESERAAITGLEFQWTPHPIASPTVRTFPSGWSLRAAAVPLADDGTFLVAFRARDDERVASPEIHYVSKSELTSIPVEVPGWIRRRAEDAVTLRTGEAVALIGTSPTPGLLQVIAFLPRPMPAPAD